jgi:hypothetical protein
MFKQTGYDKTDKAGFIKSVQETLASQQTIEIKSRRSGLLPVRTAPVVLVAI